MPSSTRSERLRPADRLAPRRLTAIATVLTALLIAPAAARAATVTVSTSGNNTTCARDGSPCATIDRAVAVAVDGDTVQVGPGQFTIAAVTVYRKRLTFLGARAGVRGADRNPDDATPDAPETVLTTTAGVGNLMTVQAPNVVVDGFTFTGNSTGGGLRTYNQGTGSPPPALGGYRIVNNVFAHNRYGLFPQTGGAGESVIADNLFLDNTAGTGTTNLRGDALYTDRARDLRIEDNVFQDNSVSAVITTGPNAKVSYLRNVSVDDDQGLVVRGVDGLTVADNAMQGGSSGGIVFYGAGNRDMRIERNQILDKGSYGLQLTRIQETDTENGAISIRANTITGNNGNGIRIAPFGAAGKVTVADNRIVGNANGGLRNQDTDAEVRASRNWWGCNTGPGTSGCDDVTSPDGGTSAVIVPWLTLSLTAIPPDIAAGAGAVATASLANLSTGGSALVPSRISQTGAGPFFGTALAAFASTPAGAFDPVRVLLAPTDLRAESAFTAGQRPTELRVSVDNETARIQNATPPEPDLDAGIIFNDPTLTPGQPTTVIFEIINAGNAPATRLRACLDMAAKLQLSGRRCRAVPRLRSGHTRVIRALVRARPNACRGALINRLRLTGRSLRLVARARARMINAGPCTPPGPCPAAAQARRVRNSTGVSVLGDRPRRPLPVARAAC